jgi:mono/diheme cytochrome c family protein
MRSVMNFPVLGTCLALLLVTAVVTAHSRDLRAEAVAPMAFQSGPGGGDGDDDEGGNPIEGRRIFVRENCYSCHGGFAGGGFCPSLREDRPDTDDVREVVREGTENGMPPFPQLTEQDIRNLGAYFQSLRTQREPTFTHWWEPVPTQ